MRLLYTYLLLCIASVAVAEEFTGQIQQSGESVPDANVIILELDEIGISDADGVFFFEDIVPGSYTLRVIAPGLSDKDFTVTIPTDTLVFELGDASVIEEEIIVVTASEIEGIDPTRSTFSKEAIQTLPIPNNNPFDLILGDTGVIAEMVVGGPPFRFSPAEGNAYALDRGFSVYGGDLSWNKYYFNYIRIPTNYHAANALTSVITREVTGGITSYKGIPAAQYIPTLGASTVVESIKDSSEDIVLIGVSPVDPRALFSYTFNNQWSMFTSVRQSIINFTLLPLINKIVKEQPSSDPSQNLIQELFYGDFVFTADYVGRDNQINITSLIFYDILNADTGSNDGEVTIVINDRPVFGAWGISWDRFIGDSGQFTLLSYFSLYDSEKKSNMAIEETSFSFDGTIRSYLYDIAMHFTWGFGQNTVIKTGTELSYNDIDLRHTYFYSFTPVDESWRGPDTLSFAGAINLSESIITNYYFFEHSYTTDTLELTNHAAMTWMALHNSLLPSLRSNISWDFTQRWNLTLTAGWGPAIMEGIQFLDRRLTEETYLDASESPLAQYFTTNTSIPESDFGDPVRGITASPALSWDVSPTHRISLTPYVAYYYNFSSIYKPLMLDDDTTLGTFVIPNMGVSGGGSIVWTWDNDLNYLILSYTASTAEFHTDAYGWITTSTDTRHQIKMSYVLRFSQYFNFGLTASAYMDKAFTPYTIVDDGENGEKKEYGTPFSARSLSPSLSLIFNVNGNIIDKKRVRLNYRVSLGDLLAGLRVYDRSLKEIKPGASTANASERVLEVEYSLAALLTGVEFALEVVIKL